MALTDKAIKAAKPTNVQFKLADSEGLYLLVYPTGRKAWKLKFRIGQTEKKLHLGYYPEVSLVEAREARNEARKTVRSGIDPTAAKKLKATKELTFNDIALEWHEKNKVNWSKRHQDRTLAAIKEMEKHIGGMAMKKIEAPHILQGIREIESRKAFETAQKTKQTVGQVFFYAIAIGKATRNPANDLRGALEKKPTAIHNPHLTDKELPAFLEAFSKYKGYAVTNLAFKFLLLTFVRTSEMRFAKWDEFDFEKNQWRIPAERMKSGRVHIVPLATQTLAVLKELKIHTGKKEYLFIQKNKDKPISENAVLTIINAIGYKGKATGHGFRATASTILNEHGFNSDYIERQLAHVEGNKVRAAYNHAEYLPQRKEMMQWWGDYLTVNFRN